MYCVVVDIMMQHVSHWHSLLIHRISSCLDNYYADIGHAERFFELEGSNRTSKF